MRINPIVYLAGPIAGTKRWEAVDWRDDAAQALADRGIEALSPMRAKASLSREGEIGRDFHAYEKRGIFFTAEGIMARDHADVCRADAILVNLLGATEISAGTPMELAWAYDKHKPVVVAIEEGNPYDRHPMVHAAIRFRVPTLEEAVDAVAIILNR